MRLHFSAHEGRRVNKGEGTYQVIHTIKSLIQQLELQMWGTWGEYQIKTSTPHTGDCNHWILRQTSLLHALVV